MNKVIPIKTNIERFFIQYLDILSPITRIQGKEAEVLAELMYQNYLKSHIPEEDRFKLIFSPIMRSSMINRLDTSGPIFRNAITKLRKLGAIIDNRLHPAYVLLLDKEMNINFKFKLEDYEPTI